LLTIMGSPSRLGLRHRLAIAADAPALVELIRAAYRGTASYERWTSEEHLVRGTRTDERAVLAAIESAGSAMLVVEGEGEGEGEREGQGLGDGQGAGDGHGRRLGDGDEDRRGPVACCRIADRGDGLAHFGMFAVDPACQGAGTGRQLVRWAELAAAELFGAHQIELEVLAQQELLRAWYERLGYAATGETRPFPADPVFAVPMRDDLSLVVLSRKLSVGGGAERV
jgi:ribosomal protein S18 acetylase RimI-like enzyme